MDEVPLIARGKDFSSVKEPAVAIRFTKIRFNPACLRLFPDTDYIQFAVYPENKMLRAVPAAPDTEQGVRWSGYSKRREPREISCKDFSEKLYRLMDWNPENFYRLTGKVAEDSDGKKAIAFDLEETRSDGGIGVPADKLSARPLIRRFTEDTEILAGKETGDE